MNLLTDQWLPVKRQDNITDTVAITELLSNYVNNPIVDIIAPRPDFRSALYQLLIGIIQVSALPEDEEHWQELWEEPYSHEELQRKMLQYQHCFEIDSDGPAFMQDFDLPEGEQKDIAVLLIEAPGGKTIKDNLDHFIKRDTVKAVSPYWATVALYSMQTFAPAGGVGHRVGLRGGGPLTTIVLPQKNATLWEKVWLNIICEEKVHKLSGDSTRINESDFFPWLKQSKESKDKGTELLPIECHPFHMYFGMPRRMRLEFTHEKGICDLTGTTTDNLVKTFITKNYGNNYDGPWIHPLNAYAEPKKDGDIPLSIKGQPGGVTYRHWRGLAIDSEKTRIATVVKQLQESEFRKEIITQKGMILWASGFDMDNMKARCWYESTMPLFSIDSDTSHKVSLFLGKIIESAVLCTGNIKSTIKAAWFNSVKDAKGDISFLDTSFWQNTEPHFYTLLEELIKNIDSISTKNNLADQWLQVLRKESEILFDSWVLTQQEDGLNMKRVIKARNELHKSFSKIKKILDTLKGEVA